MWLVNFLSFYPLYLKAKDTYSEGTNAKRPSYLVNQMEKRESLLEMHIDNLKEIELISIRLHYVTNLEVMAVGQDESSALHRAHMVLTLPSFIERFDISTSKFTRFGPVQLVLYQTGFSGEGTKNPPVKFNFGAHLSMPIAIVGVTSLSGKFTVNYIDSNDHRLSEVGLFIRIFLSDFCMYQVLCFDPVFQYISIPVL